MRYLAYCIVGRDSVSKDTCPHGIEGRRVNLMAEHGTAAAFSPVPDGFAPPDMHRVIEYARVIEALHKICTVIPMRYGCLFETRDEISDFLCKHREELENLLVEFDGCVEMGVRLLFARAAPPRLDAIYCPASRLSGTTYLAERKTFYAEKDDDLDENAAVIGILQEAFRGLSVKCRVDHPADLDKRLISLYFLIRRDRLEAFRETFAALCENSRQKLLLTGPWPPYNFVSNTMQPNGEVHLCTSG